MKILFIITYVAASALAVGFGTFGYYRIANWFLIGMVLSITGFMIVMGAK